MSCGSPHQTPCTEVLGSVFLYIDHELNEPIQLEQITVHLQECSPCAAQFEVEQRLRELVSRTCLCSSEETPDPVRQRVMERITQLRIEMTLGEPETE